MQIDRNTVARRSTALALALAIMAPCAFTSGTAVAAVVTINGLDYDLDQFVGASVTTTAGAINVHSSTFDNPNGIDGVTLGELASGQFGGDEGDRITLGESGGQQSLTLNYGNPFLVGPGDASLFVVFEQSGDTVLDPEGTSYEIAFDGGTFVGASSAAATATGGVVGAGGTSQNQVAFNLLHDLFGFSVGDLISSVTIRNLGSGGGEDDPDLLFAARAGTIAPVPLPAALPLLGAGLGLIGLAGWRRRRTTAQA